MFGDLRHAVRLLLRTKGWTAVVVVSLAVGIGANTALFSIVNGMVLRKIPVAAPDTLVRLRWAGQNDMATGTSGYGPLAKDASGRNIEASFSKPMFDRFRADNQTLTDLFACLPYNRVSVVVNGDAEVASGFLSTGNYYQVLGVPAVLGRTILPDDDRPDVPAVAVISYRYWQSRFGGEPSAVGASIRVNNVPATIVGVLPATFTGVQQAVTEGPDVSLPLSLDPQLRPAVTPRLNAATIWWLQVMGRLKPGVTAAQVQANLGNTFQVEARSGFESYRAGLSEEARSTAAMRDRKNVPDLLVDAGARGVYEVNPSDLRTVSILSLVVALVLLIVCANVANLLLSRAAARQREIGVRLSLGATRARLVRQLLTESLLLASIGGGFGILIGYWGQQFFPGAPGQPVAFDWRVLSFVAGVSLLTGIVFGIAPALRATDLNLSAGLKEGGRSVTGSRAVLSKALLVVQVAVSLVLLVGAGLFLRTLQNLRSVNVGFNPTNLVLFRVNPQLNRYDEAKAAQLYQQLLEHLPTVPGVRGVAFSEPALLSGNTNTTSIFVQGRSYAPGKRDSINRVVVSQSFFDTIEIPLLLGRGFNSTDTATSPKVVVINQTAARQFFPNTNPIGLRFGGSVEQAGQLEIVGVLADAKYNSLRAPAPPTMYVPLPQTRANSVVFEVRTDSDAATAISGIRDAVKAVDASLPLMDVSTQAEQVEQRFVQEKVLAQAYTIFGGVALVLASVGLFGLMSYSVARRTSEIGIRMALGAQPGDVLRLVMRESLVLVGIGVVIGLVAAYAGGRFVAAQLFGVAPTDWMSITLALATMVIVAAFAAYLPARRASKVDPLVALHYE